MNDYMKDAVNEKIKQIKQDKNTYELGRVIRIKDYILEVTGLQGVAFFEEVKVADKAIGYVNAIHRSSVMVLLVKQQDHIHIGDEVSATGHEFRGAFSIESVGHITDMFAVDKLNGKTFKNNQELTIENRTTPIMDRGSVNRPLYTGITGIDLLYPIGKGQRQLIIGDKKTGKTQIALDAIANQKGKQVLCIYITVGKTKKNVKEIYQQLLRRGAMKYTLILAACNDDKAPILHLTPYAGLSIAEYFMKKNYDVLVVIDDLKRHADVYREISLNIGKEPGRDAYPSDIFYTHSRMLEKGCQHKNGGSITILPIVETRGGDITDYISTNIISITDGQIVLSKKNFDKGQKPAIQYGLSVSRLGGAVQEERIKKMGSKVKRELLSYLETREIYELANMDEMGEELRAKLTLGQELLLQFHQYKFSPRDPKEIIETFQKVMSE